jgi:hypothetical protein
MPEEVPQSERTRLADGLREAVARCTALATERRRRQQPLLRPQLIGCDEESPLVRPLRGVPAPAGLLVRVGYLVRVDGSALLLEVDRSAPAFVAQAIAEHLASCRFQPASQGGAPVEVRVDGFLRVHRHDRASLQRLRRRSRPVASR